MSNELTFRDDFVFSEEDLTPPEEVIQEYAEQLKENTRNYVKGIVEPYTGKIESYIRFGLTTALDITSDKKYDIQKDLGVIGDTKKKFEFYLGSDKLPNYKFRIMFFEYEIGIYPVKIVLEQRIADEIKGRTDSNYILNVRDKKDLQNTINTVFSTTRIHDVMQGIINASIVSKKQLEQQETFLIEETTVNRDSSELIETSENT